MSLLFIDGFDHYATADIGKKWASQFSGSIHQISPTAGRRGAGAFQAQSGAAGSQVSLLNKVVPAASQLFVGFGYKISAFPTALALICEFFNETTRQGGLYIDTIGRLVLIGASGAALTNGTYGTPLALNTYVYIEVGMKFLDSAVAGDVELRVNGASVISNASGDTKGGASAVATTLRIGAYNGNYNHLNTYDDLYLADSSGSVNNSFLGDCRVDTIFPTSDGTYSQFTPSAGASHFALVDETTPNTTDYNDGAASGDRDSYGMGNLAALVSQTVHGVQVNTAIMKNDAGVRSASPFVRSGSTNSDGTGVALGTSQTYVSCMFETDPNTAAAWTETTVNAMEAGAKVTA